MKQFLLSFLEVFEILAVVLISIYLIYGFIAQPFLVQGASMEPNFQSGEYLLVDEVTYNFREPERGEVIVFRNPTNHSEFYIKRIVGLPGEEVVVNGNTVLVDGNILEEDYLALDPSVKGEHIFQLDELSYFVMGDNRAQSFDSRSWGPLDNDLVIGIVRFRFWPPVAFGALDYSI